MSALHLPTRAHRRLVAVLVTALVGALTLTGLGPAPQASAAAPVLSFVAASNSAGNRTTHTLQIPATVTTGDTMVVFMTTASGTITVTDPTGWTLLQSKDGTATRGRAWTRKATATDAGTNLTVTTSALAKSVMSLAAYRSTQPATSTVTASASLTGTTSTTTHTAPTVAVAQPGSWLVNSWSEKSSTDLVWTKPAASTTRTTAAVTGGGKVSTLLADSGAPVPTGTAAARTATTSLAGGATQLFSVVVSPGLETTGTNQPPVPSFTTSCTNLTCSFNASATTDPENNPLTYAWNYGDGATGTGITSNRTYTSAGTRTVTLTVTDGINTATTTRTVSPTATTTPPGTTPGPNHQGLVPETPRTDMPKISNGEIWDIEIVGTRVFIAGTFSSIANQRPGNTTSYARNGIASYNMSTGLVDTGFNPQVAGGAVDNVEATPDGTKLYIIGNFTTVKGVSKRGLARLDPATGAAVAGFTSTLNARGNEIAASNTTVYIGGRFTTVNGTSRVSLAAVNATTGAVDTGFVNNLSGGIGVSGALGVQRLVISHDQTKLVVIHTGRQVNGQDRYGIALINLTTKQLLPWSTDLWKDNLQFVGGIQRIYGGDIAPGDEWFAVTSGSGGDRPPINDTVVAFNINEGAGAQPKWITRNFDSTYSIAISEKAVYIGGHFGWTESPTSPNPWPGLDDVGYGNGQGLSGYSLGDAVVVREHLAALNPVDGKALDWAPPSNSYEGNKAMEITPRGLFTGGDATTQGGSNVGRIAFFDFNNVPASNGVETAITEPINGRVNPTGEEWVPKGTASVASGTIARVELQVYDRDANRYLADDRVTWGTAANTINTALVSTGARTATWSLPLTMTTNRRLQLRAQTFSSAGTGDNTPAAKKTETFGRSDAPPTTSVNGPPSGLLRTMTFTVTGNSNDDIGVNAVTMQVRDGANRYLQADGSVSSTGYTFRITPDVVGAKSTSWSREITVPTEGDWRVQTRSIDTSGQSSMDTNDRSWIVSEDGQPPTVSISTPVAMVPPTAASTVNVTPGSPITFSGTANDGDDNLNSVEITLRNSTTREQLASDGSFSENSVGAWYTISPTNLNQAGYNWSYTTPFDLKPGTYSFAIRATDQLGLTTSSANQGKLTLNAQVPGDAPPNGTLNVTGTVTGGQTRHLDLAGTATDDKGVSAVRLSLYDQDTSRYLQPNLTMSSAYATVPATLASPNATSTTFNLSVDLPTNGDWAVTAYAFDTVNQQDTSTAGATARYRIYPGDLPPTMNENLLAPGEGASFTEGRIFVSGRAEDDVAMQRVEVGIVNSLGQYMSSGGTFTSTTASWRTAFLNSPGTPGSNFSYTTPVIPPGSYTVITRGVDSHDQIQTPASERHVTVSHPPGNTAPVAKFTVSCVQNVCTYDGRTSTDENAATLTYAWNFGNGTGTGPLPKRTYTSANTYNVTLTVTDEWGVASTTPATGSVVITEPTNNVAPTPVINLPSCNGLVCNLSGVGSADTNAGDTFTYLWNFGDGTATSTSSAMSHTFPAAGTYTVTLTTTDGWGKAASITRVVSVTAPPTP